MSTARRVFTEGAGRPFPQEAADPADLGDCPECMVPGSVAQNFCEVCFAELDEVAPAPLAS